MTESLGPEVTVRRDRGMSTSQWFGTTIVDRHFRREREGKGHHNGIHIGTRTMWSRGRCRRTEPGRVIQNDR